MYVYPYHMASAVGLQLPRGASLRDSALRPALRYHRQTPLFSQRPPAYYHYYYYFYVFIIIITITTIIMHIYYYFRLLSVITRDWKMARN